MPLVTSEGRFCTTVFFLFFCSSPSVLHAARLLHWLQESRWNFLFAFLAFPALLQLCVLPFLPESPRYLLIEKRDEAGAKKGTVSVTRVGIGRSCLVYPGAVLMWNRGSQLFGFQGDEIFWSVWIQFKKIQRSVCVSPRTRIRIRILCQSPGGKLLFSDFIDILNKFHSHDNKQLCKNATFLRKHGQMNISFWQWRPSTAPNTCKVQDFLWAKVLLEPLWNSGQTVMKEATSAWNIAQQGSSAESQLLAWSKKKNKPGAVFEELVLPEAIALPQIMIDKKASDTLKTVPPSPTVENKT